MEPRWYLNTHQRPLRREPLPFESEVQLKYQRAQAAEIINWVTPIMNALSQRYPKSVYKNTYYVSSVHSTVEIAGNFGLGLSSPTEKM